MIKLEVIVQEIRPNVLDLKMAVIEQNEPTECESMFTDLYYAVTEKLIRTVTVGPEQSGEKETRQGGGDLM